MTWRPESAGHVVLSDDQLCKIGFIAVCEANAKAVAAAALRPLERLDHQGWKKLERVQFSQISKRLQDAAVGLDADLEQRLTELETVRKHAQELRHIVVHAVWGEGGADSDAVAFDYGRAKSLDENDILHAVNACSDLKRIAHWSAFRVAELIDNGTLPERSDSGGVRIRTSNRLVRL